MASILCSDDAYPIGSSSTIASRAPFAPKPGSYLDNLDDLGNENHHSNTISASQSKGTLTRGSVAFTSAGGTRSRVTFSSLSSRNQKKKKKLIISGIGVNEMRKFEGVKRWCETFGEVRQIMRMPNGDLQVDFRLADVADTVCRLRAKVYITGVGSVQLSWCYSSK
ncbi:hypothetical protein BDQ12DRAFT_667453 [Crucibulum laeve]|uniref:RRM domain-containing protein n=1 Tax=Crucibulum laeve TaxID=68775 RepID=A0A5C3LXS1_9AGAR|nr:hypothetical protein BDQ12DRAFT_667453 [Crucibulum laeve]